MLNSNSGHKEATTCHYSLAYFAYDKADTSYGKIPNEQAQAQSKLYLDKALSLDENPEYEAMQARMIEHLNRERQKLGLEPVSV